jgi:ABC-type transport system involved in cytochrome bd biosynthesis fused ATPase/permease subunit
MNYEFRFMILIEYLIFLRGLRVLRGFTQSEKQSQSFDFAQDKFIRSAFRVLRSAYCVRQFLPMAQEIATASVGCLTVLRASQ